jgi:flagellar hook-associated protein 1 FlgK
MAISFAFNVAQTGLKAHQKAIDITSNNIANASNKDYTRERVQLTTLGDIRTTPGDIGLGIKIESVVRIKDIFLFNRFTDTSANLQNLTTQERYLKEISTYFPDVTDNGIYKNLKDFFNSWQNLASNPNDSSAKVDLASKTKILVDSIKEVIHTVTDGKCGLVIVMENNKINGIITDGDVRRAMEYNEEKFFSLKAKDLMTIDPKTINKNEKLTSASDLMNKLKVNSLLVVDNLNNLIGIVQMYDLGI